MSITHGHMAREMAWGGHQLKPSRIIRLHKQCCRYLCLPPALELAKDTRWVPVRAACTRSKHLATKGKQYILS